MRILCRLLSMSCVPTARLVKLPMSCGAFGGYTRKRLLLCFHNFTCRAYVAPKGKSVRPATVMSAKSLAHLHAVVVVEELRRCGVEVFCVSPGARAIPLIL